MRGMDKGLVEWRGRPLIAWLHDQVRPITDDLIISCNRNAERYAAYADQLAHDDEPGYPGPMAGIRAALARARHAYLLVLPCDSPLIDHNLLQSLRAHSGERPVIVRQSGYWQPMFCLIPVSIRGQMDEAWRAGERSPQRVFRALDPIAVECEADDPRLANLNTHELLLANPGGDMALEGSD
jgi:molybdopterin-guanine dinucleotide biosynthesis protein A